ncbi:hypothetical protein AK812_SmicGene3078 [Symbiodinium microadriaticum]|uniref:Uncharacterized protein n=1 Tax=Symbiodinium microadriaticum TaxID=2951 RepID=A0A1Q9F021_SYMMI|nr:hypothetical protein AK812_SmicGene3078 [Symbiodinium microadriaticum]
MGVLRCPRASPETADLKNLSFLSQLLLWRQEVTAEIEKLQQQQIQHENTSKAVVMWVFIFNTTATIIIVTTIIIVITIIISLINIIIIIIIITTIIIVITIIISLINIIIIIIIITYFVYDADKQLLCLVDAKGQRVPRGETRPLPSQVAANASAGRQPERPRSRSRRRSRSPVRERERARSKTEPAKAAESSKRPAEKEPSTRSESAAEVRHQPIHFPGGDPLAKLAPSPPEAAKPALQPKKKKRISYKYGSGLRVIVIVFEGQD